MKIIKGIPGAPGIVSGKIIYFSKSSENSEATDLDTAIERALGKVNHLEQKALSELGEENAKIFSAYKMLLEDAMLTDPIKLAIESGSEPEIAVKDVTESMAKILASKNNEYMRQRADDIRYIGNLLADILTGRDGEFFFPDDGEKYILAAHELTPVDTMLFDSSRLAGLVTELGGATSHTVILAKSIGIPAVVGASGLAEIKDKSPAYLDGYKGVLAVSPDVKTVCKYEKLLENEKQLNEKFEEIRNADAYTKDGERISVCINIGKPSDLTGSENEKFDGVGLFRSEFLYSSSKQQPTVDEQREAYKAAIEAISPNPVTIRTIDVGGDKQLEYLNMKSEENPFLGNRGIRLCLNNTEIFSQQLEAILTAGAGQSVKVMLPMITCIDEIQHPRTLIDEIKQKLDSEGTDYCKNLSLGIMIETPASAIMADAFAKHCDFFSIGTNDLVQYIMAADRGNFDVENIYNPFHPAVLRMLNNVIKAGKDIEVSVCGDLAANTDFTEVLLGMGLKKFSVPLPMVNRIKYKISTIDLNDARKLAEEALKAEDESETEKILRKE